MSLSVIYVIFIFANLHFAYTFVFELQGKAAGVGAVGHLFLPFNLTRIFSNHEFVLHEFRKFSSWSSVRSNESDLSEAYATYAPIFRETMTRLDFLTEWGSNALNELALYLGLPCQFSSNSTSSTRPKRQAIAAAIGSVFSIGLGFFEESQILAMKSDLVHQQHEIGGLITIAHQHERQITHNYNLIRELRHDVYRATSQLHAAHSIANAIIALAAFFVGHNAEIAQLTEGFFQLSSGHLSPLLVQPQAVIASFDQLKRKAEALGFVPSFSTADSLFSSAIAIAKHDNIFTVVVKIPFRSAAELDLYKFMELPLLVTNKSALIVKTTEKLIAVDKAHAFHFTLTQNDFMDCDKRGDMFSCPSSALLQTNLSKSCLGALMLVDIPAVKERCSLKVAMITETHAKLVNPCFAKFVFPPAGKTVAISCPGFPKNISRVGGNFDLQLKPGCEAAADNYYLKCPSSLNVTSDFSKVTAPFIFPFQTLFAAAVSNEVDEVVRDWNMKDQRGFEDAPTVDEVLERLDYNNWQQIAAITVGVCMAVLAGVGGILYRIRVRCRQRNEPVGPHLETTTEHQASSSHLSQTHTLPRSDANEFPSMVDALRMC